MTLLQPVGYDRPVPVVPGITVEFINAGHLLGSAYARLAIEATGKTLLFGGDLGRYGRPVLPDPDAGRPRRTCCSSSRPTAIACTRPTTTARRLAAIITRTAGARRQGDHSGVRARARRGAAVLDRSARRRSSRFPSCRSTWTARWRPRCSTSTASGSTSSIPNIAEQAPNGRRHARAERQRLRVLHGAAEGRSRRFPSRARCRSRHEPAIVISSSGMATGGRVLHHLARALPDARNTVLFCRLSGRGHARPRSSRTARSSRASTGRTCRCAREIEAIDSMSAHADANEIMRWLGGFKRAAGADVPRARRARPDGRAQGAHRARAAAGPSRRLHIARNDRVAVSDTHVSRSNRSTTPPSCSTTRTASRRLPLDQKILIWHLYAGGAGRARHLLRPALPACARDARGARGDPRARPARVAPEVLAEDPALREALLDQLGSAQQPDGAQVRAQVHAGGASRRRRVPPRAPARAFRSRPARRSTRLLDAAGRSVLRSGRRPDRDEQDAGRGPRHPHREREQPVRSASRWPTSRASRSGTG